ncbi:MAG: PAS domain S-box protein [Bacteroidales bacterium]|nr:PAS domain S-box protein [Bacteroidales bacterium]
MKSVYRRIITPESNVPSSGVLTRQCVHLYQELVEFINEPCFLFFNSPDATLIVNLQMARLLGYAALTEFYKKELQFEHLVENKELSKIVQAADEVSKKKVVKLIKSKILRRDGTYVNCMVYLKPMFDKDKNMVYGYLGTIQISEKRAFSVDKSLIHLFNEDGFSDEVIVVMDFKGNILAANKKFYAIDFFLDFSAKNINLFNSIDKLYQPKLARRIKQLREGIIAPITEYKLVNRSGRTAHIEIYSKTIMYKSRRAIVSLVRDITLRKETEKELLYTVIKTEEKERQRFAQDLHDELGPFLSGLKLYLNEIQENIDDTAKRKVLIAYLSEMIDESVNKVRALASNLTPQNMIDIGLTASVKKTIDRLNLTGRINIVLETEGQETGLDHAFIITLYRIILELINKTIKHSQSREIRICIKYAKKDVQLFYSDDGIGFDLDQQLKVGKGIGLKSILSRIEMYEGKFAFKKLPEKGFELSIDFPARA